MKVMERGSLVSSIIFPVPGSKRTFPVFCLLHLGTFTILLLLCTKKTGSTFLRLFSQLPVSLIQKDALSRQAEIHICFFPLGTGCFSHVIPTLIGSLCSDSGVYLLDLAPGPCKCLLTLFSCFRKLKQLSVVANLRIAFPSTIWLYEVSNSFVNYLILNFFP